MSALPTALARWLWPLLASLVLVGVLLAYADSGAFAAVVAGVSWLSLAGGIALLQCEGLASAVRTRQLAPSGSSLRACLLVTAWWVAALAILPARLGEVSGLHQLSRRLGQSFGQSLNNLFVQRLFDGLVLLVLGTCAIAAQTTLVASGGFGLALLALALVVLLAILRLSWCFALAASWLTPHKHRRFGRRLLRAALHGRRAAELSLAGRRPLVLAATSTLKWLCNLGGVSIVVCALLPAFPALAAATLAVLVNLAAIVPLATVGGVGLGDLTIAGGLAWYGVAVATAASVALCVRALLLMAPLLFWALVIGSDRVWPEVRPDARR